DHFQDEDGDDEREGKENAKAGFEGVFHDVGWWWLGLKSAFRKRWMTGWGSRLISSTVPRARISPSYIMAIRSAIPKARSRSWVTRMDVTWMRRLRFRTSSPMITALRGSSSLVGSS